MNINAMLNGQVVSHVPAFLAKLWRIVDDPETNDLICWSEMGNSFIIHNQATFSRDLLPLYYKHNNMASFVRQLNMYGFHKVVSVEQGGLRVEKDEMEFAHPFFLQGQEPSLELIKRKIPASKNEESRGRPENLSKVLMDVRQMKGRQESMDTKLVTMKRENEALWRELSNLRQKHAKQQQIVSKLLQFLVGMMSSQSHRISFKRRMPLMLDDVDGGKSAKLSRPNNSSVINDESSTGPVIHEVFESDEPLLVLSIPKRTQSQASPGQPIRVASMNHKGGKKLKSEPLNEVSTAATNVQSDIPEAENFDYLLAPQGQVTLAPSDSAGSPYVSELLSVNSMDSDGSAPESPVAVAGAEGFQDAAVPTTDMVPVMDEQLIKRDDLDLHLDDMQIGLESLKDLLQGTQYSIDTGTLSGVGSPFGTLDSHAVSKLFGQESQEHLFGLVNENNEKNDEELPQGNELVGTGSELVSYNPCLFELAEDDSHFFEDVTGNGFLDDELKSMLTTDRSKLSTGSM